ncbi:AAA family ATPase [Mesorhizobium sp.]|uniref:AAA family ATPase n=1 Tax=Mesorhizobium sp. TaxID=1871066 RepID=UPI000FE4E0DF|nr:AAA family ATPase [Mesorhizobium sp.]RWK58564.1 MAG: MobA/MobL protein [Mesorhizobium sp.]
MAIAFARARYISRSDGGSAVRSAAYNGREAIKAQRTGEVFYFKHREAPEHHEVLLPDGAPAELASSDALWNAAEAMEKRKDAQLARELVLALPANQEVDHGDRVELARSFALEHFVSKGLAVQLDVHAPHGAESEGERANYHAHLLITTRRLGEDGFAARKARDLDPVIKRGGGRAIVAEGEAWGALWRDHQNRYFAEQGLSIRVDATSAVPQEHIGPLRMRVPDAEANVRAEHIRRANEEAARDPDHVLAVLTRNQASFSEYDLDRHLKKHIRDEGERAEVKGKVLGRDDVLALHDRETGESAGRWTTRAVRDQEVLALADGRRVGEGRHRDVGEGVRQRVAVTRELRADQLAAFDHATGSGGLKIIEGRAGTGKSFALGSIREAHEAAGYRVVGLAPTNAVAQTMKEEGFARSSTVHAELFRLKNGRVQWDRRTLVVVDEAAMMDAKVTGEVLREARLSGAKVVLAGDDRQLGSIERGGLFTELKKEHGSAEITQVTRQKVDWQREAARGLSDGRFEDALRAFARNKAVVWTSKQDELRDKLVERWAKDSASNPSASRFVFAYTNKDVDALNKDLRAVRRERGELGEDFVFTTKHGEAVFAVGDRVQFTDTLKGAGIYNGNAGVITNIDRNFGRIGVVLDAAAGREGRKVEWHASEFSGFRHGYAGTIYKGQGKTLDHTYLMHTHHWRAASSYVALTRQRESATIFVATQIARDLRQLARQLGRNEIKSASVAYATRDELTPEQRAKLDEARAAENARPVLHVGQLQDGREREERQVAAPVVEGTRAGARIGDKADRRTPEMQAGAFAKNAESQRQGSEHQGATLEPALAKESKKAGDSDRRGPADDRAVADKTEARQIVPDGSNEGSSPSSAADQPEDMRRVLIPAFQALGSDDVRRDSFGRSIDERSIAAAVSRDADIQRERDARSIYLETAYRDPKSAARRLDDIIARDGPTSAAQRISADAGLLGELRGREGFFAGAKAREEREAAHRTTAAIGPNIVRTAEFENRAEQSYRAEVEKQMKADAVEVRDVSDRAKAALGKIAAAKDDRERAEAFKVVSADQEVSREIATFRKSIEARFGEEGGLNIARAAASAKPYEHPSVPKSEQGRLNEAAALYSAARSGEVASRQHAETERLAARESQSTRLKQ